MKYFTIKELTRSSIATRYGIDNIPNNQLLNNIVLLIDNLLDNIREIYGKPIIIDSGFRCEKLNRLVGGVNNSLHLQGMAADMRTVEDTPEENKKLWDIVVRYDLDFDLMINEFDYNWIHISYGTKNRKLKLISKNIKGKTVYEEI